MNAEEIINNIREAIDCYYEDDNANTLIDKLETIIMLYHEELHPQSCGETLLVDSKETDIKDFHITLEQIEEALNKIIKPDDICKDFIIPGFLGSVKFNEEFKQELIKTIKNETSKP